MTEHSNHWRPLAAYLYVLHLDGSALAWEYLRRNPTYREAWQERRSTRTWEGGDAQRWGLRQLEDPKCNGREVWPDWIRESEDVVLVQPASDLPLGATPFHFWALPGNKRLSHEGRHLVMTTQVEGRVWRLTIARTLADGMGYAYAVLPGPRLREHLRAIEDGLSLLDATGAPQPTVAKSRPGRGALLHMRTLQALDGTLAGASHREVAEVLCGSAIVSQRWEPDSDLRAQVRRLIRRGKSLMAGGYRRLLQRR